MAAAIMESHVRKYVEAQNESHTIREADNRSNFISGAPPFKVHAFTGEGNTWQLLQTALKLGTVTTDAEGKKLWNSEVEGYDSTYENGIGFDVFSDHFDFQSLQSLQSMIDSRAKEKADESHTLDQFIRTIVELSLIHISEPTRPY